MSSVSSPTRSRGGPIPWPESLESPAFPTRNGTRREKDSLRTRVVAPVVNGANELRAAQGRLPIRARVMPHTFRRTYITFLIAAGYDLPYVQAQVGHANPALTLSIYALVMRRPDRDQLREEIRQLLGTSSPRAKDTATASIRPGNTPRPTSVGALRAVEKAGKSRGLHL